MGVYAITTPNETPLLYNAVHMNACPHADYDINLFRVFKNWPVKTNR